MLRCAALLACWLALPAARVADARASPLGLSCRQIERVQRCDGLVRSWDGVPLDTTVVRPLTGAGRRALVIELHGFGNSKYEYLDSASTAYTDNAYDWAKAGYAVLTFTARGLWGSCGTPEARLAQPIPCAKSYIHLADARYEVRDAQELAGRLVDDGEADPARIGVTGDSYGGGQSFILAALRDRVMLPDGRLVRWRTPRGVPLRLAAAAPVIPWTDLVGAIAPNGLTRSTGVTPSGAQARPVGVFKLSIANAIFAAAQAATGPGQPVGQPFVPGRPMGYLAPPGLDPQADVAAWVARSDAGEPYTDPLAKGIVSTLERYHSAYGIDQSHQPAPLFVGAGFTDDIFPVDETLRFVNRLRRAHPRAPVRMYFGDFGHQRATNRPADRARLLHYVHAWFDHYLLRHARRPPVGVVVTTQACPRRSPSGGPFFAASLRELSHQTIRYRSNRPATIASTTTGDLATALAIDPVTGGGDACAVVAAGRAAGTAVYRLPAAGHLGQTLIGAPVIEATLRIAGSVSATQIAARLWDVAPDGRTRTLVARGLLRPSLALRQRFELHPAAWRFAPGHSPELELLGADPPYGRPSSGVFSVTVERLELGLPIRERP